MAEEREVFSEISELCSAYLRIEKYRRRKKAFIKILTHIYTLLIENGFTPQAGVIRKALFYLHQNALNDFLKIIKSIWVGAGAAWEVYGFKTREQEREFQVCFIELSRPLKSSGIKFRRAKDIADVFEKILTKEHI